MVTGSVIGGRGMDGLIVKPDEEIVTPPDLGGRAGRW